MTTKQMYDRGLRCRGKGFCHLCKDKDTCVEYEESESLIFEAHRKIVCPAIYGHFKRELKLSDKPNDYIYATMFVSKPKEFTNDVYSDEMMQVHLTEENKVIHIFRIGDIWYHSKEHWDEDMVIYKSLYDAHMPYARPYEMFASLVDRKKYPNIKQDYKLELIRY